ncbi:MAG: acetoin utilization protein AcuC [Gammaproteobacteria bacterium]|nr:acetoin utilization protein AcuC [Gammaproteobacteria bacterium]MDH3805767.1 acetoin utilization protein AcuC [Gammaproteobacteria bacterium]
MQSPQQENTVTSTPAVISDHRQPATSPAAPRPLYVGSDVFRRAAFGKNHPLKIVRHSTVLDLVRILGWLPDDDFRTSSPVTVSQLTEFHDLAYVEALQYADSTGQVDPEIRSRHHIGTFENPLFPGLFERAAMTVGGSIMAAELASEGHVVFHPSGGTHHGRPDRASGFCYFNDPVFAIRTFLKLGRERVLYVDLDAHHGDGVENAFVDEPRVMTLSIHEQDRWPYSGAAEDRRNGGARNLPVPRGCNDSELDYLVQHAILPLADSFSPDAMLICCGADCLAGDPLSGMMLSNVALWDTVEKLTAFKVATVVLGGGGYNPWTVARYWTGMWGRLTGQAMPQQLPEEAQIMLRKMSCDLIDEEDVEPAWLTSLVDSPYNGPVREAIKSLAAKVVADRQP